MSQEKLLIGFIGQGFVGKSIADDVESRGFEVIRYSLEEPYVQNKDRIKTCSVVFICLPTPTTPKGFDDSIVRSATALTKPGATVVIKSTIVPGTTLSILADFPDLTADDIRACLSFAADRERRLRVIPAA